MSYRIDSTAGTIAVAMAMAMPVPLGDLSGSLLELEFDIAKTVEAGARLEIDLRSASLNEDGYILNPIPQPGPDATDGLVTVLGTALPLRLDFTPGAKGPIPVIRSPGIPAVASVSLISMPRDVFNVLASVPGVVRQPVVVNVVNSPFLSRPEVDLPGIEWIEDQTGGC